MVKTLNITLDDNDHRKAKQVKDDLDVTWAEFVVLAADELAEDTGFDQQQVQGDISTSLSEDRGQEHVGEGTPADIDEAITAIDTPGSGPTKEQREEALRKAYEYLKENGSAQRQDFKNLLGDDVGYANFHSWWQNYIHNKDALKRLPGVSPPSENADVWHYTEDDE